MLQRGREGLQIAEPDFRQWLADEGEKALGVACIVLARVAAGVLAELELDQVPVAVGL
jgi:acyl-CoA hydrolase